MILYNDRIITNSVGKWFQRPLHMVTTYGNHGSVNANPNAGEFGTNVTLSNTPDTGYNFTGYSIAGDGASLSGNTLTIGYSDVSVTGNFGINVYSITYNNVTGGNFTGPSTATYGTTITVNATAKSGYTFNYITVNGVRITGNTFTMPASNVVISGEFAVYNPLNLPPYTLRLKYTNGVTPDFGDYITSLRQVSSDPNVWDMTYVNPKWHDLVYNSYGHTELLEVLGAGDLSGVVSMSYLFDDCSKLTTVPVFITSNVTAMSYMFSECESLTSIPEYDISKLVSMHGMFNGCSSITTIPAFDTTNITDMGYMLKGCSSLVNLPLLNTSNVTNMSHMLEGCSSLNTVPLFDTSNVVNMNHMFYGCRELNEVPLFDTSNVVDMSHMFAVCKDLPTIPVFDTSSVTSVEYMFDHSNVTGVPLFDTSNVVIMDHMFDTCPKLVSVPNFDMSNTIDINYMFANCVALESVPNFDTSAVSGMERMFYKSTGLKYVPLVDTSNPNLSMNWMFQDCFNVESGALALYQQASQTVTSSLKHQATFFRCGRDTTTGAAELAQIPSDWK